MKSMRIMFAVLMGIAAGVVMAQSEGDFQGWMKQVAANNGKLKGGVEAKDAAAVTTSAKALEDAFKQVEAFFVARGGAADAVALAKGAHMAAAALPGQASAGNWDGAAASAGTIGSSCGSCHMAHRMKGANGYQIK